MTQINHYLVFGTDLRLQIADDGVLKAAGVPARHMQKLTAKELLGHELTAWIKSLPIRTSPPGTTWSRPAELKITACPQHGHLYVAGAKSYTGCWVILVRFAPDCKDDHSSSSSSSSSSSDGPCKKPCGGDNDDQPPAWFAQWLAAQPLPAAAGGALAASAAGSVCDDEAGKKKKKHKKHHHHKKHHSNSGGSGTGNGGKGRGGRTGCPRRGIRAVAHGPLVGSYQGKITFTVLNSALLGVAPSTTPVFTIPGFTGLTVGTLPIPFATVAMGGAPLVTAQLQGGNFSGCLPPLSNTDPNCPEVCQERNRAEECRDQLALQRLQNATLVQLFGALSNGTLTSGTITGSLIVSNTATTAGVTSQFVGCFVGTLAGQFDGVVQLPTICNATVAGPGGCGPRKGHKKGHNKHRHQKKKSESSGSSSSSSSDDGGSDDESSSSGSSSDSS